ncbi:hypothetical protein DM48_6772 [Burkholderia gladioli]|uniref:Uncharacterized protein n=1 Tax=Burkholderia gladioli TaxID=28095 RepID=A0AAW3ES84_BURGA|nr:hypothetical protein [Burkholderia gladioli]KGC09530.1 hypothetical protein DM48_6772 [Burkholderia gladioli]
MSTTRRSMPRLFAASSLACVLSCTGAAATQAQAFLAPDQAFRVRMTEEPGVVVLHFDAVCSTKERR